MLNASLLEIVWRTLAATLGILMLAAGLIGYFPRADAEVGARGAARGCVPAGSSPASGAT